MTTLTLINLGGTPAFRLGGMTPYGIENVYGATLHPGLRAWVFPAFRPVHADVLADLRKVCPTIDVAPTALEHAQRQDARERLAADFSFVTSPFAHQKEGLDWLLNNMRGGLFFDPGLGKCKITVDLQRATGCKMLILCPRVVLRTWQREFRVHGGVEDVLILEGSPEEKQAVLDQAKARTPAALVTTYETAVRYTSQLMQVGYNAIVADESHRIKGNDSIRTQAALQLSEKAARRVLLSGTPSLGSPLSLYAQLRFLGKYFAPESWVEFKKKFAHFPAEELAQGRATRVTGYKNLDLLRTRILSVCLRKVKEECLDLPAQQIIDVPFTVSDMQREAYNQLVETRADTVGNDVKYATLDKLLSYADGPYLGTPYVWAAEPVALVNKLEQVTGGFVMRSQNNPGVCNLCPEMRRCVDEGIRPFTRLCKTVQKPKVAAHRYKDNARAEACSELLESLLEESTNKIIIWTRYIEEIAIVEGLVKGQKVDYVTVRGGMTTDALEAAMKAFNEDPKVRVYVGQVASGIGVTLNAANYGIYYSVPWSHEQYIQSLGRNYRIGQTRRVTMYRLLGEHTLDVAKARALDQKIEIEDILIGNDRTGTCLKHSVARDSDAPCTCDGSVIRIVAKMKPIP